MPEPVLSARPTLFQDVNIIDVEAGRVVGACNVLVAGGTIAAIGRSQAPDGVRVVNGAGRYLLPGLFDCHVHVAFNGFLNVQADYRKTLKQFLVNGVTQIIDFFTVGGSFPGSSPEHVRDDVNEGRVLGPWFLTSYGCLNAPGGFCSCSVGAAASEVVTMADVERELQRIHAVRPDFVKIVYDDVFGTLPNLTPEILGSLIERAHDLGYPAAVHIATLSDAEIAVDRGADILGHGIIDPIPQSFLRRMAESGVVMIPTVASYEARSLPRWRIALPAYSPTECTSEYARHDRSIYETKNQIALYRDAFVQAVRNVPAMLEASVRVVAGSDSGTWYTFPGEGLHRELALYWEHGVPPAVVLRMATIDAARAFRLDDRLGTVAEGKVANLVLLRANPLQDVYATRSIEAVMLRGDLLDLDALRREVSEPDGLEAPVIDDEICSPHHLSLARLRACGARLQDGESLREPNAACNTEEVCNHVQTPG
jgi:imidazolonepropionase-like amidohydrolase